MGIGGFGTTELILILLVVLLVFGAKRLPEIGSSLGRGIREFKNSVSDIKGEVNRQQPDARSETRTEVRPGEGSRPAVPPPPPEEPRGEGSATAEEKTHTKS